MTETAHFVQSPLPPGIADDMFRMKRGLLYMASGKRLYMEQKDISPRDKFTVYNEDHNPVYYIQGSITGLSYRMTDSDGNEILQIRKRMVSMLPAFLIVQNGKTVAVIRKRIKFMYLEVGGKLQEKDLHVTGNYSDFNFSIRAGDSLIGRVDNECLTWGDVYGMEFLNNEDREYVVAVTVIMDAFAAAAARE